VSPTAAIVLLWAGFAGTHLLLSSLPVRQRIVTAIGAQPFLGLYSLVALGFFVPLVRTYFAHKHAGDWWWGIPHGPALRGAMYLLMAVAFILMVAALARPSPAAVVPGDPTPRGIYRITRHPLMMAFVVFGLAHLLPNGSSADVAFFGGFVLFSLVGAAHQDARKRALGTPGFTTFTAGSPFVPFTGGASAQGLRELSPVVVGLGILVTVVVRWFHALWFGG